MQQWLQVKHSYAILVGHDQARDEGETYVRRVEVSSGACDGIN